jgi:polyisoprenoid-binding protein YceI
VGRRVRRLVLFVVALVVVVIGGGFAVFALRGSDEPPPPSLSEEEAPAQPEATSTPDDDGARTYEVLSNEETFVGYRVREEFVTFGVVDAVGRTSDVSGTATVGGDRMLDAVLETDMTTLESDESRRDNALRQRGIETATYPTAEFRLTEPFPIVRRQTRARGELTLHGQTRPITATVRGQRLDDDRIELVGEAPIEFDRFEIEPPSVAGFVTVRDTGTLEFKLRFRAR